MSIDKQELFANLRQLPSLSALLQEIIASFSDPNLDSGLLANRISQDLGLTAKLLRVANSSFYGLPRKVGSVAEAVTVLGFDSVRSLVLSAGMVQAFPAAIGSPLNRTEYWQHSFRVAAIAKSLAKDFPPERQLAFTAGMFHNIGVLVLDLCMPQQFAEILQRQATFNLDLADILQAELGFDQAAIGADILNKWNFPPAIETAVRYWRHPQQQKPFAPLVYLVHIAACLEAGMEEETLMTQLSNNGGDRLQISGKRIAALMPERDQLDAAARLASPS